MPDEKLEQPTRKSRRTGLAVKPQRATEDAWYETFAMWSFDQQDKALEVLTQLRRLKAKLLSAEMPVQEALIEHPAEE